MFELKRSFCLVIVVCLSTFSWSATNSCKFKRGDSDGNGTVNVTDCQHIWNYAYEGGSAPPNLDAADANDDGYINGNDSSFVSLYLYSGGNPPPDPGPNTADCDPTTSDALEPSCTPVGTGVVATVTAEASASGPLATFDCNAFFVLSNLRKVGIFAENSEATTKKCVGGELIDVITDTPCCEIVHNLCASGDLETKWDFTWNIASSPAVERLAFNTGCTKLHVKLDWRAKFETNTGACTQQGGGCPTGDDWFFWSPANEVIKFTFRNQTTLALHTENVSWQDSSMFTSAFSHPNPGNPCPLLTMTQVRNRDDADIYLPTVTWTGNNEWKLEKIEVNFFATWTNSPNLDNSDTERIKEHLDGWSIYLETFEYQNL